MHAGSWKPSRRCWKASVTAYLFVAVSVGLSVISQVLQKQVAMVAVADSGPALVRYMRQLRFWIALSLMGFAMIFWLLVLHGMEVSKAYTLLSINYAVMVPISRYMFAEQVPWTRWVGAIIIAVGVGCISWS